MSYSDTGTVEVVTWALGNEAALWDRQSERLAGVVRLAGGLRLGRIDAGIFQVVVSTYDTVVDWVTARCDEGRRRTGDIAAILRAAANAYDTADLRAMHAIRQPDGVA